MSLRTAAPARPLRVASHLAPSVLPAYALVARRVGEALSRPAELVVAADYRRCVDDVDDICFVCSIPYLLLSDAGRIGMTPLAAPVLLAARHGDRPVYDSEAIVRTDSPYRSLADLNGSRWAYNEPFSHSGFVTALHQLAASGHDSTFIGEWIETGFHDDAIHAVLDGHADWAAVDSQVLDLWRGWHPALRQQLRTVAVLGPSTIQPVVASTTRLTVAERTAVTETLLTIHEDPMARRVLGACGIRRFIAIEASAYDDIRRMLARVDDAGLLPDWWWPRWERITATSRSISRRSPERARSRLEGTKASRCRRPPPRRSSPPPSRPPS